MRKDYQKFTKYLSIQNVDQLRISFKEIEKILGNKLPPSAYRYESWWSNSSSQPFMKNVIRNGWRQYDVGILTEIVKFERLSFVTKQIKSL